VFVDQALGVCHQRFHLTGRSSNLTRSRWSLGCSQRGIGKFGLGGGLQWRQQGQ
jgi:hypothetical protein